VSIASAPEGVNKLVCAIDGAGELIPGNFEPGKIVMVANSKPAKAEVADRALGRRDLPQLLDRNRISICKSGRQTSYCRLIPRAQPQAL
jgi:hypothetical protein